MLLPSAVMVGTDSPRGSRCGGGSSNFGPFATIGRKWSLSHHHCYFSILMNWVNAKFTATPLFSFCMIALTSLCSSQHKVYFALEELYWVALNHTAALPEEVQASLWPQDFFTSSGSPPSFDLWSLLVPRSLSRSISWLSPRSRPQIHPLIGLYS